MASNRKLSPAARDKFIQDQIAYWRELLNIDTKLQLKVKYATNNDPVDKDFASIDRDMIEYRRASMEVYDEVFASPNFEEDAEDTICHEILHLAFNPLISYCHNMFTGDEGKQKELERQEEHTVTLLADALTTLRRKNHSV